MMYSMHCYRISKRLVACKRTHPIFRRILLPSIDGGRSGEVMILLLEVSLRYLRDVVHDRLMMVRDKSENQWAEVRALDLNFAHN